MPDSSVPEPKVDANVHAGAKYMRLMAQEDKALAEEGLAGGAETWPEYRGARSAGLIGTPFGEAGKLACDQS
jgi:hypothetical protein